ncbi:MAG: pyridoxamine 5'-phosphate oxidase family protein [Acidobacteria bacterium]|nr:pyridoxamine 5'-phosphate oxidase family protein [Acidobacteriota bacterium]
MSKWGNTYREIWEKAEWAAIATSGDGQPHVVGAWGDDLRRLTPSLDETIVVPAGRFHKTEENLIRSSRIEVLLASRQVRGTRSPGQGCSLIGTGEVQTSGQYAELARTKFPWARGALVIRIESAKLHL